MALSCSKKLSALLRGITSNYDVDFYCLNCLHSFGREKKNANHIKKYLKIKIFVTLQCLNRFQKSDKTPFIIYANL